MDSDGESSTAASSLLPLHHRSKNSASPAPHLHPAGKTRWPWFAQRIEKNLGVQPSVILILSLFLNVLAILVVLWRVSPNDTNKPPKDVGDLSSFAPVSLVPIPSLPLSASLVTAPPLMGVLFHSSSLDDIRNKVHQCAGGHVPGLEVFAYAYHYLSNYPPRAGVVVDIGANEGGLSLPLLLLGFAVYAVEAIPSNVMKIQQRIRSCEENLLLPAGALASRYTLFSAAAFDVENDTIVIDDNDSGNGQKNGQIKPGAKADLPTMHVIPTIRLSQHLPPYEKVLFAKIDVEGSEGHAIGGLLEHIQRQQLISFHLEYTPCNLATTSGVEGTELLTALTSYGYSLYLTGCGLLRIDEKTATDDFSLFKLFGWCGKSNWRDEPFELLADLLQGKPRDDLWIPNHRLQEFTQAMKGVEVDKIKNSVAKKYDAVFARKDFRADCDPWIYNQAEIVGFLHAPHDE